MIKKNGILSSGDKCLEISDGWKHENGIWNFSHPSNSLTASVVYYYYWCFRWMLTFSRSLICPFASRDDWLKTPVPALEHFLTQLFLFSAEKAWMRSNHTMIL